MNHQEYWEVLDKFTGRSICHCGEERDAFMLISLDPQNRVYRRMNILRDNVINVDFTKSKELPGQLGLPSAQNKLNSGVGLSLKQDLNKPIVVK